MKTPTLFRSLRSTCMALLAGIQIAAAQVVCPTTLTVSATSNSNGDVSGSISLNSPPTSSGVYMWSISDGSSVIYYNSTSSTHTFPNMPSGSYSVCAEYNDSIYACTAYGNCAILTVTNTNTITCNAAFSSYTDSSCVTHFTNTSTGSNLTYEWYDASAGFTLVSTQQNPNLSLGGGSHWISLYTYSNGQYCDSVTHLVNVACSNGTTTPCNAAYNYYTDSSCVSHFTNTSTGSNLTYEWYDVSAGFTLVSTQQNPNLSLGNGSHWISLYTYSNGQYCDSITHLIAVNCGTTTPCNASYSYFVSSGVPAGCITHFYNNSTGTNLSYEWYDASANYSLLSTQSSPVITLSAGLHTIVLYTYSGGVLCDSLSQVVNANCSGTGTTTCNASFTYYTDSTCTTHFYNTSTGTGLTYQWYDLSNAFSAFSTMANPVVSLSPGYYNIGLYVSSNGSFCDSTVQQVYVSCNNGNPSGGCNAAFQIFADSANPGNYFAYDLSTGSGLSYLWDFGDGTTSTQQYPFHQYATIGHYVVCLTVTSGTCSSTYCDSSSVHKTAGMSSLHVIPNTVTGISEASVVKTLKAYPNPMTDELNVEIETNTHDNLAYTLTDGLGRVVVKNDINSSQLRISTASLDKGFYFLSVSDKNGKALKTIKLVK